MGRQGSSQQEQGDEGAAGRQKGQDAPILGAQSPAQKHKQSGAR